MVIKQIGIQSPAAQKLFPNLKRDRLGLDITGGEINVCDLSV
jgi:hypothetical protein